MFQPPFTLVEALPGEREDVIPRVRHDSNRPSATVADTDPSETQPQFRGRLGSTPLLGPVRGSLIARETGRCPTGSERAGDQQRPPCQALTRPTDFPGDGDLGR